MKPEVTHADPLRLVIALRESRGDMLRVFTSGACYQLCKILQAAFPNAEPLYSELDGHWITEIVGRHYDIGGLICPSYVKSQQYEHRPDLEAGASLASPAVGVRYDKYEKTQLP